MSMDVTSSLSLYKHAHAPCQVHEEVEIREAGQEGPGAGVEPPGGLVEEGRGWRHDVGGIDALALLLPLGVGGGRAEEGFPQRLFLGCWGMYECCGENECVLCTPPFPFPFPFKKTRHPPPTQLTSSSASGGLARLNNPLPPAAGVGVVMARGRVRKAASTAWRVSPETKTSLSCACVDGVLVC